MKNNEPVAWIYDLDMGHGRKSINWTTTKNGDWDSVHAVNIRPLFASPMPDEELRQILDALDSIEVDVEGYETQESKDRREAAIKLIESRLG